MLTIKVVAYRAIRRRRGGGGGGGRRRRRRRKEEEKFSLLAANQYRLRPPFSFYLNEENRSVFLVFSEERKFCALLGGQFACLCLFVCLLEWGAPWHW